MTPPTLRSQRRWRSSVLPSTSVPRNPTRRSSPRRALSVGSTGRIGAQPARRRTRARGESRRRIVLGPRLVAGSPTDLAEAPRVENLLGPRLVAGSPTDLAQAPPVQKLGPRLPAGPPP